MSFPFYISWCQQKNATHFTIASVDGATLTTTEGLHLIDMTSISYQAHFGHNHPVIINHIKTQLDSIPMSSPKGIYPLKIETTKALLKYMKKENGKIFYTTGGAETIENALKMARDITKKKIVLARQNSYHGATLGALNVTGDWRNPAHITPLDWVVRIPEPDVPDALALTREIILKSGPENIAAMILETITGGNGVYAGTNEWWKGLKSLCTEFNIMLIMDEVVCGFERTGKPFGYMHYDCEPDFICLAKGITGGMIPFGALWTTSKIADYYEENMLSCGLTNYAHPLGMAAMRGVLEIVNDQKFQDNLRHIEKVFKSELNELEKLKNVSKIRVQGMLCAIELHQNVEANKFFQNGLYLVSQTKRIILAPPLIMSESLLKEGMKRLTHVLKESLT
jgi:taurine--2-oxoglutarate transaminase